MRLFAAALLAAAACTASAAAFSASSAPSFDEFVNRYGKTYTSWTERVKRHKIYDENVALISSLAQTGMHETVQITKARKRAKLAC